MAAISAAPPAAQPQAPAGPRIVAVGDVHGAGPNLAQILQAAGLIDAKQKWIGGTARLVQTGDILDRGADVRAAYDLLIRLEGEARRAGGRIDVLFGNHEGMNVLHDFRDVSPEAMARFADARSDDRLQKAFDSHASVAKRAGNALNRDEWMKTHPRGFPEYVEAFGPSGSYGRWMRSRKAVLQIGDTIFMHAGLHPERTITIDEINRTVEQDVRSWDDLVGALVRVRRATTTFTLQEVINAAQVEIGKIAIAQKTGEPIEEYVTPEFIGRLQFLMTFEKLTLIEADGPLWYRGPGDDGRGSAAGRRCAAAPPRRTPHRARPHAAAAGGSHPHPLRRPGRADRHRHAHQLFQGRPAVGTRDPGRQADGDLPVGPRAALRHCCRRQPGMGGGERPLIRQFRLMPLSGPAGSRASRGSRCGSARGARTLRPAETLR